MAEETALNGGAKRIAGHLEDDKDSRRDDNFFKRPGSARTGSARKSEIDNAVGRAMEMLRRTKRNDGRDGR